MTEHRLFLSVGAFVLVILALALSGCAADGSGPFHTRERSEVLHSGELVVIGGSAVGYCKHAWKTDPATGELRAAIVFGHPQFTDVSPWGEGVAYDYERINDEAVKPFCTRYGCIVTHVYVHPDEGTDATEEVHRASWIRVVWTE